MPPPAEAPKARRKDAEEPSGHKGRFEPISEPVLRRRANLVNNVADACSYGEGAGAKVSEIGWGVEGLSDSPWTLCAGEIDNGVSAFVNAWQAVVASRAASAAPAPKDCETAQQARRVQAKIHAELGEVRRQVDLMQAALQETDETSRGLLDRLTERHDAAATKFREAVSRIDKELPGDTPEQVRARGDRETAAVTAFTDAVRELDDERHQVLAWHSNMRAKCDASLEELTGHASELERLQSQLHSLEADAKSAQAKENTKLALAAASPTSKSTGYTLQLTAPALNALPWANGLQVLGPIGSGLCVAGRAVDTGMAARALDVAGKQLDSARRLQRSTDDPLLKRLGASEAACWQERVHEAAERVGWVSTGLAGSGVGFAGAVVLCTAANPVVGIALSAAGGAVLAGVAVGQITRKFNRGELRGDPAHADEKTPRISRQEVLEAALTSPAVLDALAKHGRMQPDVLRTALEHGEWPEILSATVPTAAPEQLSTHAAEDPVTDSGGGTSHREGDTSP